MAGFIFSYCGLRIPSTWLNNGGKTGQPSEHYEHFVIKSAKPRQAIQRTSRLGVLNQRSMDSSGLQGNFMKPLKSHAKSSVHAFFWGEVHTFHQSFKDICDLQKVKKCSREKAKTSKYD